MKKLFAIVTILFLLSPLLALAVEAPIYTVHYPGTTEMDFRFWNGSWQYNGGWGWNNVGEMSPRAAAYYDSRYEQIARALIGRNHYWGERYFRAMGRTNLEGGHTEIQYPERTDIEGAAPVQASIQQANIMNAARPDLKIAIGGAILNFASIKTCPGDDKTYCIDWLSTYIIAVYRYGVGLAAVLAAIMISVGGFLWLSSAGNPTQISRGREFIISALTGLVLALFSFLILQTINPRLTALAPLKVKVLPEIEETALEYYPESAGGAGARAAAGGGGPGAQTPSSLSEREARAELEQAGIRINRDNPCPPPPAPQTGCTSAGELPDRMIDDLAALPEAVRRDLIITGGSEVRGRHGAGKPVVDANLVEGGAVWDYATTDSNGNPITPVWNGFGWEYDHQVTRADGTAYTLAWVDEPAGQYGGRHWHIEEH